MEAKPILVGPADPPNRPNPISKPARMSLVIYSAASTVRGVATMPPCPRGRTGEETISNNFSLDSVRTWVCAKAQTTQSSVMDKTINFTLNGQLQTVSTDPSRPLLEVLREDLDLTGTKYGCGEAQCGACTVLVDGVAVRSCVRSMESIAGKKLTTIEGLSAGGKLHPVQEAFLAEKAYQCGYCIPGMIMNLAGALQQKPVPSDEDILARMNGNICRCCGYPNIVKAIRRAAAQAREASHA
jgi:aerobic-type carbon monoxide dehydrogenase small subunit (CoxS/CutS family)